MGKKTVSFIVLVLLTSWLAVYAISHYGLDEGPIVMVMIGCLVMTLFGMFFYIIIKKRIQRENLSLLKFLEHEIKRN